jgi:serine/threonine protein kinase
MEDQVVGKEVDGYRIQEVLGRGGMGTVYKAEDVNLSRPVALKRINPGQSHRDTFIHRFRSEAKALARIDSRHITGVYALRETDIGLLIVMEYVDGGTLKDRIRAAGGPMDLEEALPILEQILQAFHDAHSAGVIHRDIKPQNIMLTSGGMVKVTDFGIAKLRRPDSGETVTQGGQGGTLKYMSPEQVSSIDDVDDRSDLYSIGMTAYEMLAGGLPFEGAMTDFDIMQKVVEGRIPPPTRINPDLPPSLATWIQTATAKAQDDRYQSAEAMLAALRDAEADADVSAESPDWDDEDDDPTMTVFDVEGEAAGGEGETVLADDTETVVGDAAGDDAGTDPEAATVVGDAAPPSPPAEDASGDASGGASGEGGASPPGREPSDRESAPPSDAGDDGGVGTAVLAGGLLALVLLLGGGYWMMTGGGGTATLTLSTDPTDATVSVNDQSAGTTPLTEYALPAGAVAIRLQKEGYREVDTVLQDVQAGQSYVIEGLELPPKPARLTVTAPSGAEVFVDGRSVGTTPLSDVATDPGTLQLRLQKNGASAERTVELGPGEELTWDDAELAGAAASTAERETSPRSRDAQTAAREDAGSRQTDAAAQEPAAEEEPATGTLSVSSIARRAALFVDGEEKKGVGTYTVRAGRREVVCRHPEYETLRTTVTVAEGESRTVGCYYEQNVKVNTFGPWGNVVVDGENTGVTSPETFQLEPGSHTVSLSIERNESFTVTGGNFVREVNGEGEESGSFSGKSYTFEVEPSFQAITYKVVFKVEG